MKFIRIRKKREITVETTQQVVVSGCGDHAMKWCRVCAGHVGMVTTEEAAALIGVSSREIFRSVENGQIHFTDTADGLLLVCMKSLSELDLKKKLPDTLEA